MQRISNCPRSSSGVTRWTAAATRTKGQLETSATTMLPSSTVPLSHKEYAAPARMQHPHSMNASKPSTKEAPRDAAASTDIGNGTFPFVSRRPPRASFLGTCREIVQQALGSLNTTTNRSVDIGSAYVIAREGEPGNQGRQLR